MSFWYTATSSAATIENENAFWVFIEISVAFQFFFWKAESTSIKSLSLKEGKTNPFDPFIINSSVPPQGVLMTGIPQRLASMTDIPNDSFLLLMIQQSASR